MKLANTQSSDLTVRVNPRSDPMPTHESYVYFEPAINLAHMSKGGRYRVTKAYADDLLKQNTGYGRIVGDAPADVDGEEEEAAWDLEMAPADYIDRYRTRYESGDVSDTVRARYELAVRLYGEEDEMAEPDDEEMDEDEEEEVEDEDAEEEEEA